MTDKIESVLNDESAIAGNGVVDDTKEEQNPVNLPLEEVQDGNQEPAVEGAPAEDALEEGELAEGTPNEDVVASQEEVQNGKKRKRRKRRKIDEYTLENDIRYRGPLSYRWLRIFAWLFLILSQVGMLLALGGQLDAGLVVVPKTLRAGRVARVLRARPVSMSQVLLSALLFQRVQNHRFSHRHLPSVVSCRPMRFKALPMWLNSLPGSLLSMNALAWVKCYVSKVRVKIPKHSSSLRMQARSNCFLNLLDLECYDSFACFLVLVINGLLGF